MDVLCETCEGTGRVRPNPFNEREMRCPRECNDGYRDAEAADLDGRRASYRYVTGRLTAFGSMLIMETDCGMSVVNLTPDDLEILNG